MSGHTQRGKVKLFVRYSSTEANVHSYRPRGQRLPVTGPAYHKHFQPSWTQVDEDWKVFSNRELTYMLCRYFLGNVGELTLNDGEKVTGVVKAISPSCEFGLTFSYITESKKNCCVEVSDRVIHNFKMVRVADVKLFDCLCSEVKIDGDANVDHDAIMFNSTERELVPYFGAAETLKDCTLDKGGFPAEEMFKTNKELFSLRTSYNPDLREYTIPVDRSAPNFLETEARCAKLAEDMERSQNKVSSEDEDEERKYSAVARGTRDNTSLIQMRYTINDKSTSVVTGSEIGNHSDPITANGLQVGATYPSDTLTSTGANEMMPTVDHDTTSRDVSSANNDANLTNGKSAEVKEKLTSTANATPAAKKVIKSTLDPNAPEFQPMCLQFANMSTPSVTNAIPPVSMSANALQYVTLFTNNQAANVPAHQGFIPNQQSNIFSPTSLPYAFQSNQMPQLMQNSVTSPLPANLQQTRGASLPPVPQPTFTTLAPGTNLLLQHPQQPCISFGQMLNHQPLIVTTPGQSRFPTTQSMSLRQRTNESLGNAPNSSAYTHTQTAVQVPAFQSPAIYQLPQPGSPFPFILSGHPQLGLHFLPAGVPTSVTSSGLMVGNLPITQSSGQQNYPIPSVLQMQPHIQLTNTSHEHGPHTPHQPPSQLQIFPHSLSDQGSLTLPPCAPNQMFAQQQARAYYPPIPHVVDGHSSVNPSMMAGLLPVLNQANAPPSLVTSHQTHMDSALINAQAQQYQQANCHPPHLMQHFPAQHNPFLQGANVPVAHHMNSLHAFAAALNAGSGTSSSQNH